LVNGMETRGWRIATRFGLNGLGYGMEYIGISRVKANYQGMYYKGWEYKARIYGFKSLMNLLTP